MYFCGSPNLVSAEMRPVCESLSNAIDQSRNSMWRGDFVASKSSCTRQSMWIGSLVERDFRNPYCVGERYLSMCLQIR